jgi:hypothetical protein
LVGEIEPTPGVGFGIGVGAGVGVGVGPEVAPDPELQPAAAMNKIAISSPATMLNAEFIFFNIARLPQISASAGYGANHLATG